MALDQLDALWDVKKLDFTKKGKAWGQKYSEDQERDEQGRFSDGGGGGGGGDTRVFGVQDGLAFHAQNEGWAKGLSKSEMNSLIGYAGFGSNEINAILRGDEAAVREDIAQYNKGPGELDERIGQIKENAATVQRLIDEGPAMEEDTEVYRGLSLSAEQLDEMVSSGRLDDPAFQSTMVGLEDRAKGYAILDQGHHELAVKLPDFARSIGKEFPERESVFARITVPEGTHYADIEAARHEFNITTAPGATWESEILLGGASYTVDSVQLNAGTLVYDQTYGISVPYHEVSMTYHPLGAGGKGLAEKYSEDQERDELGRFSDGGGGSSGASRVVRPPTDRERKNAEKWMAANGTSREAIQSNSDRFFSSASADQIEEGKLWYNEARSYAEGLAEKYGVSVEAAAAVVAACSPQTRWDSTNKIAAERVMKAFSENPDGDPHELAQTAKTGIVRTNAEHAFRALSSDDPKTALSGFKVRSFNDNIINPDSSPEVTIDGRMINALIGGGSAVGDKVAAGVFRNPALYQALADSVRTTSAGTKLSPLQTQAVIWGVQGPIKKTMALKAAPSGANYNGDTDALTDEAYLLLLEASLIEQGWSAREREQIMSEAVLYGEDERAEKEWDEDLHPRDDHGRFDGGGGTATFPDHFQASLPGGADKLRGTNAAHGREARAGREQGIAAQTAPIEVSDKAVPLTSGYLVDGKYVYEGRGGGRAIHDDLAAHLGYEEGLNGAIENGVVRISVDNPYVDGRSYEVSVQASSSAGVRAGARLVDRSLSEDARERAYYYWDDGNAETIGKYYEGKFADVMAQTKTRSWWKPWTWRAKRDIDQIQRDEATLERLGSERLARLAEEAIQKYVPDVANGITRTTYESVRGAVVTARQAGTGSPGVLTQISGMFSPDRAKRVAVTETTRLFGFGSQAIYREQGVTGWQWKTVNDPWVCPICEDLEGETHESDEDFEPAHVNCRCWPAPYMLPDVDAMEAAYDAERDDDYWADTSARFSEYDPLSPHPAEALEGWANKHGVDLKVERGALGQTHHDLVVANQMSEGISTGRAALRRAGINPDVVSYDILRWEGSAGIKRAGTTDSLTNRGSPKIQLNAASEWFGPNGQAVRDKMAETGWNRSGSTPSSVPVHELGHAGHSISSFEKYNTIWDWEDLTTNKAFAQKFGVDTAQIGPAWTADARMRVAQVTNEISIYASRSPHEFVAEAFEAMVGGVKVSDDVMTIYRWLGGPELK